MLIHTHYPYLVKIMPGSDGFVRDLMGFMKRESRKNIYYRRTVDFC